MPNLFPPPLTGPNVRVGLGLIVAAGLSVSLILFRTSSAPASQFDHPPAPDPVHAVAGALRIAVMIEGAGVYGAGILIDPANGLVLTNQHVVQDMHTPKVSTYDGRTGQGVVLAVDKVRDLALLKAPALVTPGLPAPRIGDATRLQPGEEVYAVGMPRKLAFTVSRGIVSYTSREMEGARYLQVDMNINDGNSGGPVVTASGEIVGMMSFIYRRSSGLSFALPTSEIAAAFPGNVPVIPPRL
jgi:S1-C subfamily serine protease